MLTHLPGSIHAILLRKAISISSEKVKFHNSQITMFGSIENLREAGFVPAGIIDIGANVGNWTRSVAEVFPGARIHMIEAQPALADDLRATANESGNQVTFGIGLLGAERADAVQFYTINTGSSVFEEVTNLEKEVVTLPMVPLDDIADIRALQEPIFLKLDVQDYEIEVLKGASNTLSRTEVVLMEVALLPYNKGAPLMPEVVSFMDELGFTPYDVCGQLRRVSDKALFQIDMIFVRKTSTLRKHRRFSMFEPINEADQS